MSDPREVATAQASRTPESNRTQVREALISLLAAEDDFFRIRQSCESLHSIFAAVTGYNGHNEAGQFRHKTATDFGAALGPDQAAACLKEWLRTRRYLQGVHAAIETARQRFPDERIEVLYAGCGPYALLLLPFATLYDPGVLRVSLLDIHQESLDAVRKLAEQLGIQENDFFGPMHRVDATRFQPDSETRYHLLVTETMNRALTREPQVAITQQLIPFLHADGLLVPEEVRVEAVLVDGSLENEVMTGRMTRLESLADQQVLGTVLALNAQTARIAQTAGPALAAASVFRAQLPAEPGRHRLLRLRTTIQLHGEIELYETQCSLTQAVPVAEIDADAHTQLDDGMLEIRFRSGPSPDYECNLTSDKKKQRRAIKSTDPDTRLKSRRLAFSFDPAKLAADLARTEKSDWLAHYQQSDYAGGDWDVAALRSQGGRQDMIFSVPDGGDDGNSNGASDDDGGGSQTSFAATPLLERCPYFQEILNSFECELRSVRLLRLAPGARILEHHDAGLSIEAGEARLHVPITVDPAVEFLLGGTRLEMQPGECWYANFDLPHRVDHRGTESRVHLVIDCLANDWLRRQVLEPV